MTNVSRHLVDAFNTAKTENGATAYKSTKSAVLDFFALGGAMRNTAQDIMLDVVRSAFAENKELALKVMFYHRDIRGGQGQRKPFRDQLLWLANFSPLWISKNLWAIPEYGRWDDLLVLLDTHIKPEVIDFIDVSLNNDISRMMAKKPLSLLAKWLPSENTSSKESKRFAGIIRKSLGLTSQQYRHILSDLRAYINIVERFKCSKQWDKIDYSKVPSQAMLKYRKEFAKRDGERFSAYWDSVKSGNTKVNTTTLYPQQIVHEVLTRHVQSDYMELDTLWNNLPDYINGSEENSIVVADVSGSMNTGHNKGVPLEVAISLAIYMSERNNGYFRNKFITFSERPEIQQVIGDNIRDKVMHLGDAHWDMNTNVKAVFDKILAAAINNKVSPKEMVSKIYIISDMEFDSADKAFNGSLFYLIKFEYNKYGYDLPKLVFWNVDARNRQVPMTMEGNIRFVSGYSPSIFKALMQDKTCTAYDMMLEVLNSERYSRIVA